MAAHRAEDARSSASRPWRLPLGTGDLAGPFALESGDDAVARRPASSRPGERDCVEAGRAEPLPALAAVDRRIRPGWTDGHQVPSTSARHDGHGGTIAARLLTRWPPPGLAPVRCQGDDLCRPIRLLVISPDGDPVVPVVEGQGEDARG